MPLPCSGAAGAARAGPLWCCPVARLVCVHGPRCVPGRSFVGRSDVSKVGRTLIYTSTVLLSNLEPPGTSLRALRASRVAIVLPRKQNRHCVCRKVSFWRTIVLRPLAALRPTTASEMKAIPLQPQSRATEESKRRLQSRSRCRIRGDRSWPLWRRPASGMQLWQMVDRMAARATALCLLIISASHVSLLAHPSHHPMHPHHSHSRVTV